MNEDLKKEMLTKSIEQVNDPFRNLTVKDVAIDLKMNENTANKLFKRPDFPSVNLGKTKTVTLLAYLLWKMERKEDIKEKGEY